MPTVITLHRARIDLFLSPAGPVGRKLQGYGRKTVTAAKRRAPVDLGALKASIGMSTLHTRQKTVIRIGTNLQYGLYQELGTGVYGPKHRRIRPKRAKFLRFKPKGSKDFVFARSVAGSPAHHYLRRALRFSVPWPIRTYKR